MIELGWCMGIEKAELLKDKGFDYIECALSSLQLEDEQAFAERLSVFMNSPLKVSAMNIFIPQGMKVVGPEADEERITQYIVKAGEAASRIGTKIVVFGSGNARNIPEGWEKQRAEEQMLKWLEVIAKEWHGKGVTLVIEPLNRKESNMINRIADGVHLAKQINSPVVRVLADFYHMDEENEPLEEIVKYKEWIAHIHIADTGRLAPGTGTYPYDTFTKVLNDIKYKGMISAECTLRETDQELESSLAFMRKMVMDLDK